MIHTLQSSSRMGCSIPVQLLLCLCLCLLMILAVADNQQHYSFDDVDGKQQYNNIDDEFFAKRWWEKEAFVFLGLHNDTHIPASRFHADSLLGSRYLPPDSVAFSRNSSTVVLTIAHEKLNKYAAVATPFAYFQLRFDVFAVLPPQARILRERRVHLHVRLMDVIYHSFPNIPWDVDLNETDGFGKQRQSFDFTVGWKGFTSDRRNFTTVMFAFDFPNATLLQDELRLGGRIIASREHALEHYLNASIMLGNISFRHLPVVGKLPVEDKQHIDLFAEPTEDVVTYKVAELNQWCKLYGSPHANVLHQVHLLSPVVSTAVEKQQVSTIGGGAVQQPARRSLHKVFCGIFTIESHHETHIKPILDTWAKKCHHFLAFSNANDSQYHAVSLPHLGPESYHNMWQKTRSIWQYLHSNYLEDFDYFLLGGDDMFYIMENLHAYLQLPEIESLFHSQRGVYLGRPFRYPLMEQHWYNTGGPGYLLDRTSLSKLMSILDDDRCNPLLMQSIEDVLIGNCLRFADPPIFPLDTRDAMGKSRFHFYSPGFLLRAPDERTAQDLDWVARSDPHIQYGLDRCCSESSIAFHYVVPELMLSMYDFLYKCPREAVKMAFERDGALYFDDFRDVYVGKKD